MKLSGKRAVVVGGGSGLGRATAQLLRDNGVAVAILDLARSHGAEVAGTIGAHFTACDISDHEGTERALAEAVEALGGLDIAVNVAGGGAPARRLIDASGPFPLADYQRVVELNLVASFNLNRLEAWYMRSNPPEDEERGVIINTSSITAEGAPVGLIPYASSKAGVSGLSLAVARDLAPYGIRCMAIAPSLFETGLVANMPADQRAQLTRENVFPKRPGKPEEFALLAKAIIENPMLNGGTIRLDAGTRRAIQDSLGDRLADVG
jgi:NAD(P)-dependent dehydrogenase (short-subunit alcohol dehydrogenase family)